MQVFSQLSVSQRTRRATLVAVLGGLSVFGAGAPGAVLAQSRPLTFAYDHTPHMNISIGSLDNPALAKLENQYGIEGMTPAFPALPELPGSRTEDDISAEDLQRLKSLQHPDHD